MAHPIIQQRRGPAPIMPGGPVAMIPRPRVELFTVLLVDGYPLLREALAERVRTMGATTVHEAGSVAEAYARAQASGPCDLAILDIGLPGGGGLELVRQLREWGWTRLVVLSDSGASPAVHAAFQAGVQGYLVKSSSPGCFIEGVGRVLEGGVYADPTVVPMLLDDTRGRGHDAPQGLSRREIEVLQLVAHGQSNKEIGQALQLSALTIKSHLTRIGRKLGTGDRAQMTALALRSRLID